MVHRPDTIIDSGHDLPARNLVFRDVPINEMLPSQPAPISPYQRIKEAILDASLLPGQQLVEATLADWCGVSRTPVREALLRLEQDGMVERSERGLIVRQRSPEQILDIYETRIVLEASAAKFAAERHSRLDQIRLERLLHEHAELRSEDATARAQMNREFHQGVWMASHNDALIDLLSRMDLHLARYPETTLAYPGRWEQALVEHGDLVTAILQRDTASASQIAEMHFVAARDIRLALWESDAD